MGNKSEIETKRIIVEENIVLKKEERGLRDRLTIYERLLDQILRDQEDKKCKYRKLRSGSPKRDQGEDLRKEYLRRRLILLHILDFTPASKSCLNLTVRNRYMYDYEAEEPSTLKPTVNKNTKAKQRIVHLNPQSKHRSRQSYLKDIKRQNKGT